METIEKIAEEYIERRWGESIDEIFKMQLMEAFIVGAGTQKVKDREEQLKKRDGMSAEGYDYELDDAKLDDACEQLKTTITLAEDLLKRFGKEMKE